MKLYKSKCLVCGKLLGYRAPSESEVESGDVCSKECDDIYMKDFDTLCPKDKKDDKEVII